MIRALAGFALLAAVAILPACTNATPPPGAITAEAAYPAVGTSWVMHETNSSTGKSGDYRYRAVSTTYRGAPAYGIRIGTRIDVLDPQSFNSMATTFNGTETVTASPDGGNYSWPLWVGKSWSVTVKLESASRIDDQGFYRTVTTYEDVTVPAGTYKAFRIDSSPGQGVDRAFHLTIWYAPAVACIVKSVQTLSANAVAGARTTTSEMVSPPRP